MKAGIKKSVAFIRQAGFSHIKFELEGNLNRRRSSTCSACSGSGRAQCTNCSGRGVVESQPNLFFPTTTMQECGTCRGDAGQRCEACAGRGTNAIYSNEEVCFKFILNHLAQAIHGKTLDQLRAENTRELRTLRASHASYTNTECQLIDGITYAEFYYDGSVDSELTITIPIEKVDIVPHILDSFKELAKVSGTGKIDVRGAGMHISVIPTEANGVYPVRNFRMPEDKIRNFRENMGKLLPALFFVASSGSQTRAMNFRTPQVSHSEKYSAIYTHGNTCFEYRVFETCYQRPEAIFEFIGVIAQSLKFYHDPSYKVTELKQRFNFASSRNIANFFDTPENLRILNATVKYLKPEDVSYKKLKNYRGLKYTIGTLTREEKKLIAALRAEYQIYKTHHETIAKRPLSPYEKSCVDDYMAEYDWSYTKAEKEVTSGRQGKLVDFSTFLKNNLKKKSSNFAVAV